MAFEYTINSKGPLLPANKRETYAGRMEVLTGTFTNDVADTGGNIETGADTVLFASASDKTGANPVQVEHEATPGRIVLTTTAGDDGTWFAIVQHLSK